jgi:hypothetical protein
MVFLENMFIDTLHKGHNVDNNNNNKIIIVINLTANGLSPSGSGYNAVHEFETRISEI